MTDKFGIELHIGDSVIYTTGGQSYVGLDIGTVDSFTTRGVAIRTALGRLLSNDRYSHSVVSCMPIYKQHPEVLL